MFRRLRQERHFHVARLRKMFAQFRRLNFPPRIPEREHPRRDGDNVVAITLRLQNAGQLNFVRQIFGEPVFVRANVAAVERKAPFARQRQYFGGTQKRQG